MKRPDRDTAARPAKDQPLCFLRSSSSRSFNVIERSLGLTSVQASSRDRKSTRLNSSHDQISYAVFCLKKKKKRGHRHSDRHENEATPKEAHAAEETQSDTKPPHRPGELYPADRLPNGTQRVPTTRECPHCTALPVVG